MDRQPIPSFAPHAAFTLIELMIALTSGSAIVMIAAMGYQTAVHAMTTAQRLEVETRMLCAGIQTAFDEADWWDSYDDRLDPERRPLRKPHAPVGLKTPTTFGLPFTRFPEVWGTGMPKQNWGGGWQEDEKAWSISAANPLTWWTGNASERKDRSAQRQGYYALFGASHLPGEQVRIGGTPRCGDVLFPQIPARMQVDDLKRTHHAGWFQNQVRGLGTALGFYGLIDYLPANAYPVYYRSWEGNGRLADDYTDQAGLPKRLAYDQDTNAEPGLVLFNFIERGWGGGVVHATDWILNTGGFTILPRNSVWTAQGMPLSDRDRLFHHRNAINMSWFGFVELKPDGQAFYSLTPGTWEQPLDVQDDCMVNYIDRTTGRQPLMESRPANWPEVAVGVARYVRQSRFFNQFKVEMHIPGTATRYDLRFTAMGTTLRGARRQRNLDR